VNRKDCRELAMDMAGLQDNYAIGGRDPVRLLNLAVQTANQEVQALVMNLDPHLFIRRKRFTYPADTLRLNIDTALDTAANGSILKMRSIGVLSTDADPSVTNPVYPLDPFVGAEQLGRGATVRVDGFTSPTGAPATITSTGWEYAPRAGWRLVNNELEIHPVPSTAMYLYAEWVALQILNDDTDLVLGGMVAPAELLVVYRAAELFCTFTKRVQEMQLAHVAYASAAEKLGDLLQRRPDDLGYTELDPKYR